MPNVPRGMQLLSLAAHELRTPAGVIGGCLRIVRMAGDGDPARRDKALAQAERSYERLVELLAELSDLWRLEVGEAVFNRQPVALGTALHGAARHAAVRLPEGVVVQVDADAIGTERIAADPTRLERAVAALVLAVSRHVPGPALVLRARRTTDPTGGVRVVVAGGETAAEPPETGRRPVHEFESGLGLALPIACRVIEADGGTVQSFGTGPAFALVAEWPIAR
jgi:K+-sensing histidine kinase KdpD